MDIKQGEILIGNSNGVRFEVIRIYEENDKKYALLKCLSQSREFPVELDVLKHMNISKEDKNGISKFD